MEEVNYKQIAIDARKKVLDMIYKAQTSHIGSNFSCIDIMTVLFEKMDLEKDIFILSAGWKAASLYYFLWRKGKITQEQLDSYCQQIICYNCKGYRLQGNNFTSSSSVLRECETCNGTGFIQSKFIGLSEPIIPEIRFAGGSMGFGLPAGVGFALGKKLKNEEGQVYVLMSDGELQCGTTWESALIGSHHNLDNLTVIVDSNNFQAMGSVADILSINDWIKYCSLSSKFRSFGWHFRSVDGHNFTQLESIFNLPPRKLSPTVVNLLTTKGKGVSFMENNNEWHYRNLDQETYELAKAELG